MVKLSEQLQRERPTRTERVEQKQIRQVEDRKSAILKAKVDQASETMQGTSYEDYEKEYNKLDPETKPFFLSPEKLKQTEGYKTYLVEKAEYDKQVAEYNAQQKSIAYAQTQKAEWDQAEKLFFKGSRYDPRSPVGRKIDKLYKNREMAMEDIEATNIKALAKQGITPVRKGAVVVAYKDEFGNVSYDPELKGLQVKRDPDVVYQEYLETKPQEQTPIIKDVKVADVVDDRKWYDKSMEDLFIKKAREKGKAGLSFVGGEIKDIGSFYFKGAKKVYDVIPLDKFYFTPSPLGEVTGIPTGAITPFKLGKKSIDFTEAVGEAQKDLGKVSKDVLSWAVGKEKIAKLDLELQEEFQTKYQSAFEQEHMKDIVYEKKTFEQASMEFETSAEAKKLQKDFEKEYGEKYADISRGATLGKKLAGGSAIVGLSFAQLGLSAIKTPKSAVLTAGLVYTGYGALRLIPSGIGTTVTIGFGAYGGYKAFSPTSTVEEAGGGIVMLGLSGLTLGYQGYKFLRSPVIKTVSIKPPKISTKASSTIARENKILKDLTFGGKTSRIEQVDFGKQKLGQQVIAGRKTIITSKIRSSLKLDPIYEGVPFQDPKGYQKAFKKLTDYSYTSSQARATLRYSAPVVRDTTLREGSLLIFEKQMMAKGKFAFVTEQKAIKFGSDGLKTRGKKTIVDVYDVDRQLVGKIKIEQITKTTQDAKLIAQGKSRTIFLRESVGKALDTKSAFLKAELRMGDLKYIKKIPYRYQDLIEVSATKQIVPSKRAIQYAGSRTTLIKAEKKILQQIDLDELMGVSYKSKYGISPAKITKTPLSKTFGSDVVDDIKKIIDKKPTSQVSKIISKQAQANVQQLKSSFSPPDVKLKSNIKDLINIKQLDKITGVSKFGSALSTKALLNLKTDLKTNVKLKQELKSMIQLKDLLKDDVLLKTQQLPALKTSPALKQDLKLKMDLKTPTGISLKITAPNIPKPAQINIPIVPIPAWLKTAIRSKMKKKKKGQFEEFALLPDFTSRAIGLDPEIITGKQAQARIKKILTGLEVRRGVRLK